MLAIVGIGVVSIIIVIARTRVPGGANAAALGWMSEHWLADYRASRLP